MQACARPFMQLSCKPVGAQPHHSTPQSCKPIGAQPHHSTPHMLRCAFGRCTSYPQVLGCEVKGYGWSWLPSSSRLTPRTSHPPGAHHCHLGGMREARCARCPRARCWASRVRGQRMRLARPEHPPGAGCTAVRGAARTGVRRRQQRGAVAGVHLAAVQREVHLRARARRGGMRVHMLRVMGSACGAAGSTRTGWGCKAVQEWVGQAGCDVRPSRTTAITRK